MQYLFFAYNRNYVLSSVYIQDLSSFLQSVYFAKLRICIYPFSDAGF